MEQKLDRKSKVDIYNKKYYDKYKDTIKEKNKLKYRDYYKNDEVKKKKQIYYVENIDKRKDYIKQNKDKRKINRKCYRCDVCNIDIFNLSRHYQSKKHLNCIKL